MKINKIGVEIKFRCDQCGKVVLTSAQTPDSFKMEGGEKEIVEHTRGLVEMLDQFYRTNGHDRTQHSQTCPEYRRFRTKKLDS